MRAFIFVVTLIVMAIAAPRMAAQKVELSVRHCVRYVNVIHVPNVRCPEAASPTNITGATGSGRSES